MANANKVIMGYNENWYPKKEPVIPRVYHEYIKLESKLNMYTAEELGADEAYFVSKPEECKVFTYGGSRAALVDQSAAKTLLIPGSNKENTVQKLVFVKNTGEEKSFVRIYLAIPAAIDDALPSFNASYNMLHFNTDKEAGLQIGQWNWGKAVDRTAAGYIGPSGWNFFGQNINGVDYNVYIATIETALEPGATSPQVIKQVYLDSKAVPEDLAEVFKLIGSNEWEIKLAIETIPAGEYTDPFVAFAETVGKEVGSYNVF